MILAGEWVASYPAPTGPETSSLVPRKYTSPSRSTAFAGLSKPDKYEPLAVATRSAELLIPQVTW